MFAFQLHIKGLVQGVGFRPFVHKLAHKKNIMGWVNNGTDGVRIHAEASTVDLIYEFYTLLVTHPPKNAIITFHSIEKAEVEFWEDFSITKSTQNEATSLLITPDISICESCKAELRNPQNRRYNYAFTTCVDCGPRYSIQTATPYDRATTTMHTLPLCECCAIEYTNMDDRRQHSQTNSCSDCAVKLHLFSAEGKEIELTQQELIFEVVRLLALNQIIALKGTGGFLLLCNATNSWVIKTLRERKHRPTKPFAVLFRSLEAIKSMLELTDVEETELTSDAAPIVLCKIRPKNSGLCYNEIAPNLTKLGAMLPNSALLQLIADAFQLPLICTSANLSGSPIIFKDEDALLHLVNIADFIVTYDREIVAPQDDSVVQFTPNGQRIVLRRSRGLAPNFYPLPFRLPKEKCLAMGADMKSAFAISTSEQLFISQFLGDQEKYESQLSFETTLLHVANLMRFTPEIILADKHPNFFSTQKAQELAMLKNADLMLVQHHEAHFMAVLAENNLLHSNEKILGVIWDGAGLGDDNQIWGGEFFTFSNLICKHVGHFDYFPQLLGNKMSKEPRISALSVLLHSENEEKFIEKYFSAKEWKFYNQLLQQKNLVKTSSVGRLLDAISCLLGLITINTYEGEGALLLETLATHAPIDFSESYPINLNNKTVLWQKMITGILMDLSQNIEKKNIAAKVFNTLVTCIDLQSKLLFCNELAFSGGVFQNSLLVQKIRMKFGNTHKLYFHQQISPNDECIGLGQLSKYVVEKLKIANEEPNKSFKNVSI